MLDNSEIRHRRVLQTLKAKISLREFERVALTDEIDSNVTSPELRTVAIARRVTAIVEWGELIMKIEEIKRPNSPAATDKTPTQIACPHCKVGPGELCKNATGRIVKQLHHQRWREFKALETGSHPTSTEAGG